MATSVEKLILAIETREFDKAERELRRIQKAAQDAGTAVDGAGAAANRAGTAFGKMRGPTSALTTTTGQLSVQLQDIAVQAQMGTDYLRIFAQQGPQIASIFGPKGAVFGAVIAFGSLLAGPLIASILGVKEETKDLSKEMKELYDRFNELNPTLQTYIRLDLEKQLIKEKAAATAAQVAHATLSRTIAGQNGVTKEQVKQLQQYQAEEQLALLRVAALEKQYADLSKSRTDAQKLADKTIQQLTEENIRLVQGEAALLRYQLRMKNVDEEIINTIVSLKEQNEQIALTQQIEADVTRVLDQELERRARAREKAADQRHRDFVANEKRELAEYFLSIELFKEADAKREKARKYALAEAERTRQAELAAERALEAERNRRLAAQSAAENDLRRAGLTEEEHWYVARKNLLERHLKDRLISEEQYAIGKKKLEEQARDFAIDSAGDALNALGRYNKEAFEMAKAFNSAKAIMDTYAAANNALKSLPPPFNFVAAGAAVAMGLANLAMINSQTYQGRALGGQVRAGESYVVGERGPEVLTMGANGRIIPNDKLNMPAQTQKNTTVNVSFTIQANDTAGFDQLLQSRRGQIIGIINQALNDQGRRAIA